MATKRISIIGPSGTGKSTLARKLSERFSLPHVELDALYWQPNWEAPPTDVFLDKVSKSLSGDRWVTDGNYAAGVARDIVLTRADMVIWLDYTLAQVYRRLLPRTLRRVLKRETLWNGNRETFRSQFLSPDSLLLYVLKTHWRRRRRYAERFSAPGHLEVLRFRTPRELEVWLEQPR